MGARKSPRRRYLTDRQVLEWCRSGWRALGETWELREIRSDGVSLYHFPTETAVVMSIAIESDHEQWAHVSVSHSDRLPEWGELVMIKEAIIGTDVAAYQIIPERERYVNIHPYCLHLFAPMRAEYRPLPDFSRGGKSI